MPLPVHVEIATPEELQRISGWICDPAIYGEAFLLAAAPDPAWVRNSMLLVRHGPYIEFESVRFWSVRDDPGQMVGFAVDYPWAKDNDSEREIDIALPDYRGGDPRFYVFTLAAVIHRLFTHHGATSIWGRTRVGGSGGGFPRLFKLVGGEPKRVVHDVLPTTGERVARVVYFGNAETFYASPVGKRVRER